MSISTTNNSTGALQRFDIVTIDRMTYRLRYDVEKFMQLYEYFIQNNLQSIINYYSDSANNPDKESFDFLEQLMQESVKIKTLITLNKQSFKRIDDWELLDFLQTIDTKLQTIDNTDKWTRSSKTQNAWQGNTIQSDYVLGDNETLEEVSEDIYGVKGSQDDWMRIAIENDLREGDYTVESNNLLKITKKSSSSPNYSLSSIVDNLVGQKLYGLDIDRKIAFLNDDLVVKNYNDTVLQSVVILVALKKGDSPEFASVGVDPALAVGASFGSLKFSSIVRQLQEVFATDDSLRNFQVIGISYSNGALSISYKVDTFYNLTYSNTTTIQQQ